MIARSFVDRMAAAGGRFRSGMPWLLVGAACAFGLSIFVPPVAAAVGLGLVAVALVRRRADGYGMFTVGFVIWCAIYVALVIVSLLTEGPSSGSSSSYEPGASTTARVTGDDVSDPVTSLEGAAELPEGPSSGSSSSYEPGASTTARVTGDDVSDPVTSLEGAAELTVDEFPFALWGPWNDGKDPLPIASTMQLEGVVEFDGPCAYLVVDIATYDDYDAYYVERLFGSEPEQFIRVLLVFPDDSPLGPTRWNASEETVTYHRNRELREGDYLTKGDWYYSRYAELGVRLPLRWGQAGKRYLQEPDDSCETQFVLGL